MIGEFIDRLCAGKTDSTSAAASAATPARIERTAEDACKDFGVAFRKMLAELAESEASMMEVSRSVASAAVLPEMFVAPIVRLVGDRRMERDAKRRNPSSGVDLERLAGGSGDPARYSARRRLEEIKNDL
jgi:hypothetical protein